MTLDVAGFLLLAEGHLVKARERLTKSGQTHGRIMTREQMAYEATWSAIDATRHAMKLLKEEPCNKP